MTKGAIIKIVNREDLSYDEAYAVTNEVMNGESLQVQDAAFLTAVSTKSTKAETTDKISGCVAAMYAHTMKVEYDEPTLEIVGTGGDGTKALNISSISALVAAAADIKVAKHGDRTTSSDYDSVDFLGASGININQDPELYKKLLGEINICFLFARHYHALMKYVGTIRRELGFHMVSNILEPLTNLAPPQYFVLGVCDEYLVQPSANVLKHLGVEGVLVVYDQNKVDKTSASTPNTVCEFRDGGFHLAIIKPEDFGLRRDKKEELVGGNPAGNVRIAREILSGEKRGMRHTAALLNAGAALYIDGKVKNFKEGVQLTGCLIGEGKVLETYERCIRLSNEAIK